MLGIIHLNVFLRRFFSKDTSGPNNINGMSLLSFPPRFLAALNILCGLISCYFANGDYYVGAWNNDCIEGFGRYHYNTGRAFEGNFKAGKREGRGKFQQLNGSVDIYRYVDDKRAGDGVRWSKDRSKAWRLDYKGKKKEKVPLERAMQIADRCGPVVDYSNF